jgi:hypothetical protein
MTDKTKAEIREVLAEMGECDFVDQKFVNQICAIVDGERAEEVVVLEVVEVAHDGCIFIAERRGYLPTLAKCKGRLVFIPDDNFKPSKGDE